MENAAKALLIAGGILIAIILISMFLLMYNRIASIQKTQEQKKEMEQLSAFNAQYEVFNKKLMYGVDVRTLQNKVNENNINNPSEQIELSLPDDFENSDDVNNLKYKCTSIEYSTKTGKVNKIVIKKY